MTGRYLWSPHHGLVKIPYRMLTAIGVSLTLAGALAGYMLATYQHGVDGHISAVKWGQFEALKADYQERFKGTLRTSAGEAAVIVQRKEDARNGRE